MEKNVPINKKLWNIVRFVMYMLHKGISKQKLLADFNATLKRGKNLMFHKRRRVPVAANAASQPSQTQRLSRGKNTSLAAATLQTTHSPLISLPSRRSHHIGLFACGHAPPTLDDDTSASRAVLELLNGIGDQEHGGNSPGFSVEALTALSPNLSGFGRVSPSVRPLRVTDSPFPLREDGDVANGHVDKAAEEFIMKFYKNLNQQKKMIEFSPK